MTRTFVWMGLFIGSTIGSLLPELWGSGLFSVASILLGSLGGLIGIWLGYKIAQSF